MAIAWKGRTWNLRDGGTGGPGFGGWSDDNVTGPDGSGYLTLKVTNPSGTAPIGCELQCTESLGYGTYTLVTGTRLDNLDKNVVFGGLFPYFGGSPFIEFDTSEVSKWDNANVEGYGSNVAYISHNSWYNGAASRHHDTAVIGSDQVHTFVFTWTPGRAEYSTYIGTGTSGTRIFHSVHTTNIPLPSTEKPLINLWVYDSGEATNPGDADANDIDCPATDIVLRDFTFEPMEPLRFRGIDLMGWTKDRMDLGFSQAQIDALIDNLEDDFPEVTHYGLSILQSTNAESMSVRGQNWGAGDPAAHAARFCTKIHAVGKNVLWRGTDPYFEGNYTFPKNNFRTGNRFTYLGLPITDDFSSSYPRRHGYEMKSTAGSLSNYMTSHQSGNSWSISGSELVGPTANGWRRTCLFNAANLRDVTMVAEVKKVGNQQIVVRASTDQNFPGYGAQLRNGELRLERPGLASLGTAAKTFNEGDWYWVKLQATGTTVRCKSWASADPEPGSWDISVTNSNYSVGYCGFSGESNNGHFRNMTITPGVDSGTWIYRAANWIDTNHTLFESGDIIVPYPEAGIHWGPYGPSNEGTPNQFFTDLQYCIEERMAARGKAVHAGFFSHLFTGAIQNAFNAQYDRAGLATVDHYGSAIGLGQKRLSWPTDGGMQNAQNTAISSGTQTYTLPTSINEGATHRLTFTPEKSAYNQDFDVYIVNKGTGNWTLTCHTAANGAVQMVDHADISVTSNSHTVTVPNAQLVNNAWNTFSFPWFNQPDVSHHVHLTSTVGDGTIRVRTGGADNLEFGVIRQYKTNASPESFEIDVRNLHARTGRQVFVQEWGDFWSLDASRSSPVRTQAQHAAYLASMYAAWQRLIDDGVLAGVNYWRANQGAERLVSDSPQHLVGTSTYNYQLLYTGEALQSFYAANGGDPPAPSAPAAPSGLSLTVISNDRIDVSWTDNSADELGFEVERKTGAGGTYSQVAATGISVTSHADTGLDPGTTYFYRVRAQNAAGASAYLTEGSATTQDDPAPPEAATPTASPDGGAFTDSVQVALATATAGATIRYTTNGNSPTAASPAYSGPFTLTSSALVKAIAVKAGLSDSAVLSVNFTVTHPAAAAGRLNRRRRKLILASH